MSIARVAWSPKQRVHATVLALCAGLVHEPRRWHVKSMHRVHAGVLALACLSLLDCGFFPESTFELAPESRLPKWSPPGLTREEVTVTMCYYVKSSGRTATFTLSGSKK